MKVIKKFNEMFDENASEDVVITFENGDVFTVPANVIALNRTEYYSSVDGFEKGSEEWDREFEHSMTTDEILDWIQNDMNWSDLEPHATKVEDNDEPDYDHMFTRAQIKYKGKI